MHDILKISRHDRKVAVKLKLPASKSISNRVLIIRFLSGKPFGIRNLSEAEDTQVLYSLLDVIRRGHKGAGPVELNTGNAGTVLRFLAAVMAITPGIWHLTGDDRMKERPVGALVNALRQLGADIEYTGDEGYPPLLIRGKPLEESEAAVDASISSQFVSSLMMIGPLLPQGLKLFLEGDIVSAPYQEMTLQLMTYFGVRYIRKDRLITIPPQAYRPRDIGIEPDWTSASYWYQIAALADEAEIWLEGLPGVSIQGDAILPDIYRSLGIRTLVKSQDVILLRDGEPQPSVHFDFSNHPDLALSVMACCAGLSLKGRFTGLRTLRIKESDRLEAMGKELARIGAELVTDPGGDAISLIPSLPGSLRENQLIHTYRDHRMAMSFAPLALRCGTIRILGPQVVLKSYPAFWNHMEKAGFRLEWMLRGME
ncbi:MAG: 3-phosphoshikimate 1-carboxyvinyltransferase [Bacteroidales bacterium]|nr:3-phosphoshikimate 1-carboxyvinyltransferase [Bacteroidales bacterium]